MTCRPTTACPWAALGLAAAVLATGLALPPHAARAQGAPTAGPTATASSTSHQQQMRRQIAERRAALQAHTRQMEGITDQGRLITELRRHLQMSDELMALMVEAQTMAPGAVASGRPATGSGSMAGGRMAGGGMAGGSMAAGTPADSGGSGGMGGMEASMHAMEGEGGMSRPRPARPMESMGGMGGMSGNPSSGHPSTPKAPGGTARTSAAGTGSAADMRRRMQAIRDHSASLATITDQATLVREMVRHQRMVDEMLALMAR